MGKLIKTIEAPLYLLTIGLACMELGASSYVVAFLFIVSIGRLAVNIIENQK